MKRVLRSLKYIIDNDLLIVYGDDLSNIKLRKFLKNIFILKKKKLS